VSFKKLVFKWSYFNNRFLTRNLFRCKESIHCSDYRISSVDNAVIDIYLYLFRNIFEFVVPGIKPQPNIMNLVTHIYIPLRALHMQCDSASFRLIILKSLGSM